MRNPFIYGAGGVLSADIAVPEHARELEFYSQVLTTGDAPLWRDDLMNNLGEPVIGLGERIPEYESLPLQWMPHFQVADVAASFQSAIKLGGKEIMHSQTEDGQSQWAVLEDRDGAAFGLIPSVAPEPDSTLQSEPRGCIAWLSLTVPNASVSRDFYQQVIGWRAKPNEAESSVSDDLKYEMQIDDKTSAAEISQFQGKENVVPPVWLIHLPVGDLTESLRRVQDHGGKVVKQFEEEKYVVVCDPVGVHFALQADL